MPLSIPGHASVWNPVTQFREYQEGGWLSRTSMQCASSPPWSLTSETIAPSL